MTQSKHVARSTAHAAALEKIPAAAKRCGISVSQLYRIIKEHPKEGSIGPLVKLGPRASAIPSDAVDRWIAARIAEAMKGVASAVQTSAPGGRHE